MSLNVILPQNKLAHCGTPDRSGMSGFVFTAVLVFVVAMAAGPVGAPAAEKLGELDKYVRAPETA